MKYKELPNKRKQDLKRWARQRSLAYRILARKYKKDFLRIYKRVGRIIK
jgi:hypothetical protein